MTRKKSEHGPKKSFLNILDLQLVESIEEEPMDKEG
jgi:hypothetical protein